MDLTFLGSETESQPLLSRLRQLPAQVIDTVGVVPLSQLGGIAAEPVDPMPTQEYSELLRGLDDATLDRLVDAAGADADIPLAVVQIRHLGDALTRHPRGRTQRRDRGGVLRVLPRRPGGSSPPEAIEAAFGEVRTALAGQRSGRTLFNFLARGAPTSDPPSPPPRGRACAR